MKTEEEIRRHIEDLRLCDKLPCTCSGTRHSQKCDTGRQMMKAVAETLLWALGENEALQPMIDSVRRRVSRTIRSN